MKHHLFYILECVFCLVAVEMSMGQWGSNLEESWCHLRHRDANGLVRVAVSSHQSRAESWGSARPSSIAERPPSWGPARNEKKMSHEICLSRCSLGPMNQYRPLVETTCCILVPGVTAIANSLSSEKPPASCHSWCSPPRSALVSCFISCIQKHRDSFAGEDRTATTQFCAARWADLLHLVMGQIKKDIRNIYIYIYIYIYLFIYRWKKYVIRNIWKYHIESHGVIQLAVDFQNFSPCWDDPMVMAWATPVSWDGARWTDVWKWNNGIGREREIYIYIYETNLIEGC